MRSFLTCYKREMQRLLTTPLAAAMLVFYLLASGLLTLILGGFFDSNTASLADSFFPWQPWLFLFLGTALTMGSWAEEFRGGSAEILLTLPLSPRALVGAKFASSWSLLAAALLCTCPFPITCALLGTPDWGPILTGYLGCLLAGGAFLALGQCASAWAKSQFVGFLLAFLVGLAGMLAGFRPTNLLLLKWGAPPSLMHFFSTSGVTGHFEEFTAGRLSCRAIWFFLALTAFFLILTVLRLRVRHSPYRVWRKSRALVLCLALLVSIPLMDKCRMSFDCTAEKVHTLDVGTRAILAELGTSVEVVFVYSQNHPAIPAATRRHALRAEELLGEFARRSAGKLRVTVFHPTTPDEQSQAEEMGLAPQISSMGDLWFLGAVVKPLAVEGVEPTSGSVVAVPLLTPEETPALEYPLIRAVAASQRSEKRRLGVFSTLPLLDTVNPQTHALTPAWWSIQRLSEEFDIVPLDGKSAPPADLDVLLVVHPKELSEEFLEGVSAHLNAGRGLFLALDPLSRVEAQRKGNAGIVTPSVAPSFVAQRWEIEFSQSRVVEDRTIATAQTNTRRGLEINPTILTTTEELFCKTSPVTAHLHAMTFFCAGALFAPKEPAEDTEILPLIKTTRDSKRIRTYEAQRRPADLFTDFQPDDQEYILAMMVREKVSGAKAILTADADWLHNTLCVNQTTDENGAETEIPINDNGVFLLNAMEELCGETRLMTVRTRGVRKRTFVELEKLGKAAERRIQELDEAAFQRGEDIRMQIADIARKGKLDTPEVQRRLDELEAEDQRRQKQLKEQQREVLFDLRHQLDGMEKRVALWNLLLTPAILALAAMAIAWKRRR